MTDQLIREGLLGVGLPLITAGVILALAWRTWRGSRDAAMPGWAGVIAPGAAMVASHFALHGGVNQKWERIIHLILAAVAIGVLAVAARRRLRHGATRSEHPDRPAPGTRDWLVWIAAAFLTGAAAHFVMSGIFQEGDPTWMPVAIVAAPVMSALIMQPLADRHTGAALPGALALACFAQSVVLVLSGNQTFALIPASLGAASMAAALPAFLSRHATIGAGAMPLAAVTLTAPPVLGLLWVTGLPLAFAWAAGLVAFAPIMLWIGELGPIARRGAVVRLLIRLTLVAIPLGVGLLLARANAETDVYFG